MFSEIWEEIKTHGLWVLGGLLLLILVVTMCGHPASKKQTFEDKCKEVCDYEDSKVVFCSQERKVIVCE